MFDCCWMSAPKNLTLLISLQKIWPYLDERAKLTTCSVAQLCVECADGLNVYIDAYVVPLICSPVTNQCIEFARTNCLHLIDLPLADNSTGETSLEIELPIGANY